MLAAMDIEMNVDTNIEAALQSLMVSVDPRPLFGRAVALGAEVIAAVPRDRFGDRTPCRDYSVRQLMGHMVDALRRVAILGRGEDPFGAPPLDPATVHDGEWLTLWRLANHEVEHAWADAEVLTRTITLPWATLPGAAQLLTYTNEITVHTWDLAAATGQLPTWDDEVVQAALAAIRVVLPAGNREATFRAILESMPPETTQQFKMPFAEAVEIADDASPIDQLVAWNGREP